MEENMKFRWDNRYLHWGVTAFLVIAASILFYYGIFHMDTLVTGIKVFFGIMAPIIYGIAIAYLLSSVVNFMERKIVFPILQKKNFTLKQKGRRAVRWICVLLSLFLFLVVIYALIMMILPQLIRSIMNIIYSFPYYVTVIENWLNSFVEKGWRMDSEMIDMVNQYSAQLQDYLTTNILPQMQEMLKNISAGFLDILVFLKNFLIGAIVSIYVLADKEIFVAKSKMVVYALFSPKRANAIIHSMRFTHRTFGGFISGKILDSAIIGVLCYIGTTLLDMPYAILVSVIVGVTNVIPFFGPYLGAIPCILLILLVDPLKSLYFALFILALQQFDGNILGPKILGDSTGLSSFMVIVAIMVGGGFFGIVGMLIGVPLCAVIYAALWHVIQNALQKKDLPEQANSYYNIDCLNPDTGEAVPMKEDASRLKSHVKKPDGLFAKLFEKIQKAILFAFQFTLKYLKAAYQKIKSYRRKK